MPIDITPDPALESGLPFMSLAEVHAAMLAITKAADALMHAAHVLDSSKRQGVPVGINERSQAAQRARSAAAELRQMLVGVELADDTSEQGEDELSNDQAIRMRCA